MIFLTISLCSVVNYASMVATRFHFYLLLAFIATVVYTSSPPKLHAASS
jgi:hypothetical protein